MNNFNYQKICQDLLKGLSQRTVDVVERRFGLKIGNPQTLEAIGQDYGVTRERVRQIEAEGISKARAKLDKYKDVLKHFTLTLKSFGDIKEEESLLNVLGGEKQKQAVSLILTLSNDFERVSEDNELYSFWTRKKDFSLVKKVVNLTLSKFKKEGSPLTLDEVLKSQIGEITKVLGKKINKNILNSYIEVSKIIKKNPDGEYGLKDWLEINPRGVKDKAYLVLRKKGNPLHFSDIAKSIDALPFYSERKAHLATVHNELIKDSRFVLVGRGLYALKEWGYKSGLVKDVIVDILKESKKPLFKKEILDKVSKQRFVKENTILLNLQDRNIFSKDSEGRYNIKEA